MKSVTNGDIRHTIRGCGLSGLALCVHASLRSFGHIEGGAAAVVEAILAERCTLIVPTFSYGFMLRSQPGMRPPRNGWHYGSDWDRTPAPGQHSIYTPDCNEIAPEMGRIAAAVLAMSGRVRGDHPVCSFAGVGPLATEIIATQSARDVFAPLAKLADAGGMVVLMGVGLDRLTLLHLAERRAGRNLFVRWAHGRDGRPIPIEFGGCSDGFEQLRPVLLPMLREVKVGPSGWTILPAREALASAASAIGVDPAITHCGRPDCERCNDAVAGGPKPNQCATR